MLTPKEIKNKFMKDFDKNYEKYYPIKTLRELDFTKNRCKVCSRTFWSVDQDRKVCGDGLCLGGFNFINNSPAKNKLSYIEVWKKFSKTLKKFGYTPINRFPVNARWRTDINFVEASIDGFIPYVISGEVNPPANPLTIPQFCLRFNDVDNVGLGHNTGFSMLGMHRFEKPNNYDTNQYLRELMIWFTEGIGINKKEIILNPDIWAGAGNFGPSIEFFVRGLEVANQVYMQFQVTKKGYKDLNLKVLDMGEGHERTAWLSQGTVNSYEASFPSVMRLIKKVSDVKVNERLLKEFLSSTYINVDEMKDTKKAWNSAAKKMGVDVERLKLEIQKYMALYSIAEHSRSLLVALNDGVLPSNVGAGYNLRVLFRRAQSFSDEYNWNIYIPEICDKHAHELRELYPELRENLEDIKRILDVEKNKYENTKQKTREIVKSLIKREVNEDKLIELYDSQGIAPELIREEAAKFNRKVIVPEDFYAKVASLHEIKEKETKKELELDLKNVEDTKALYFDDYKKEETSAKVLKIIDNYVFLDKTVAYPTSGGQSHDLGNINGNEILEVFKQGNIIVHRLKDKPRFKVNDHVNVKIDLARRIQLAQHHTATHIINAAARKVLGRHINQAGAKKEFEKAHIDLTHYQSLTKEELDKIEKEANKIINKNIEVRKFFMSRDKAEKKYGFSIYQGPAVPGRELRIVDIKSVDVECCGGTHLDNTKETEKIKIIKATKVSDSVVRLEFVAGKAASEEIDKESKLLKEVANFLKVGKREVPARAEEIFNLWKEIIKKKRELPIKFKSSKKEDLSDKELLEKTAFILKSQPEYVLNTLKRFMKELKEKKNH